MKLTIAAIIFALLLSIPQVGNCAPPANDDRQNAESIGEVTDLAFDTTEATVDGPEACMTGKNIWYCYTATCSGTATASLCGSSFDTKLAVYHGCGSIPTSSDLIQCGDDFCGRQSEVAFPVTAGHSYLLEVGGYNILDFGSGVLNISCDDNPVFTPYNDDWFDADCVGSLKGLDVDTTHATMDGPGDCVEGPNIWYCYTAESTGEVTMTFDGSGFDLEVAIYEDYNIFPSWDNRIFCENIRGNQPEIKFDAIADQGYLIEIAGSIDSNFPPPGSSNDDCYNAKLIGDVAGLAFDTSYATFDGPGHCMTSPNIWYIYTAICTGEATVSLCGSSYDTKLAVYNGAGCNPSLSRLIECNDDSCGWQSEVTFSVIAGQQYLIEVGGFGDNIGEGLISTSCEGTPPTMIEPDLGDAPDSTNNFWLNMTAYPKGGPSGVIANYPTVYNDGTSAGPVGPIHSSSLAVAHLGKIVSNEDEADIGFDEDGLNNIKPQTDSPDNDKGDDGVIFPINMPQCDWTTFDYTVNVLKPGLSLWVNVWCDWNRDGDWDDDTSTNPEFACSKGIVSEWAVQNQYLINLPAGLTQMTTPAFLSWHPDNENTEIWMRITLSEKPWDGGSAPGSIGNGGSGPKDGYGTGETEDYYFLPGESY
ncbi:MAG: GEVED domain-containing protein [Sedimentisphaerales bacterium]|nr:GEVED domain-containing protein [Sedimentisphaerales bacterium]